MRIKGTSYIVTERRNVRSIPVQHWIHSKLRLSRLTRKSYLFKVLKETPSLVSKENILISSEWKKEKKNNKVRQIFLPKRDLMSIKQTYEILDVLNRALPLLETRKWKSRQRQLFQFDQVHALWPRVFLEGILWREKIQLGPTMNKLVLLVKEVQ